MKIYNSRLSNPLDATKLFTCRKLKKSKYSKVQFYDKASEYDYIQKGVITLESESDTLETASFSPSEYKTNKKIIDRLFGKQKLNEY